MHAHTVSPRTPLLNHCNRTAIVARDGLIVLSPKAKGGGYQNTIHYTHSSALRTIQEMLAVSPLLGDAANATDLSDLFVSFP